ncbi:MAG: patatin-like phospholipase family protein, partial [Ferruginibacter sp.]
MSRALVISGGGSKGAFAIGILKKLFKEYPNLEFDMFVGTSTGSLIVPLVAM